MANLDLNRLREEFNTNARRGNSRPREKRQRIFVDNNGKIIRGEDADSMDPQELSEVHQGIFGGECAK